MFGLRRGRGDDGAPRVGTAAAPRSRVGLRGVGGCVLGLRLTVHQEGGQGLQEPGVLRDDDVPQAGGTGLLGPDVPSLCYPLKVTKSQKTARTSVKRLQRRVPGRQRLPRDSHGEGLSRAARQLAAREGERRHVQGQGHLLSDLADVYVAELVAEGNRRVLEHRVE